MHIYSMYMKHKYMYDVTALAEKEEVKNGMNYVGVKRITEMNNPPSQLFQ